MTTLAKKKPDFYIASSEGYDMQEPRACWFVKRLKTIWHDDFMLISIAPSLSGTYHGIDTVMILPRHQGVTLFPNSPFLCFSQLFQWPIYVYVLRLLVDPQKIDNLVSEGEYEIIAWAEIYRTQWGAKWSMRMWDKQHE